MIPYARQDIDDEDIKAVVDVLRSNYLTQGPAVPTFERAVMDQCSAQHAIAISNATSALHIACLALGVGPGDEVWTSPISFVASSNCALYCGASVDFVDIDPVTFNMCATKLAEKLEIASKAGRLPKVVIPVHMCGLPAEMDVIGALGRKYGFRIIEDASHALGASYQGQPVGSCAHSDITIFSFHPVKIITTGEGGMAVTNDGGLAKKIRLLRSHGVTSDAQEMDARPDHEIWNYQQIGLGFNYRMTDIQAALGLSQLRRLGTFISKRHEVAGRYAKALGNLPVKVQFQAPGVYSAYHLYVVRLGVDRDGAAHQNIYKGFHEQRIAVNLHYIPIYLQPYYQALGFQRGLCPEAEAYFSEAVSLPMHPGLGEEDQDRVILTLKNLLEANIS